MASGLTASAAMASDPPPLDAYGALPALEMVQVSPSGARLVSVTVAGEQRAMLVTDLSSGEILGGVGAGAVKVRELQWVGEDRVLTTMSTTQAIPQLDVPRTELFFGRVYEVGSRKLTTVFDRTPGVLPILIGPTEVRDTSNGPTILARGFAPDVWRRLDLFSIDPRTGRGRIALETNADVEEFVINAAGVPIARSQYDPQSRRWSLHLQRSGTMFSGSWYVDAPIDQPHLLGMGRRERTILISADRPDLGNAEVGEAGNVFEVDVDSGEWSRLPFEGRIDVLVHHPRTQLLLGVGRMTDAGVRYAFSDDDAKGRWARIERAS
jgi:hypothetical protein